MRLCIEKRFVVAAKISLPSATPTLPTSLHLLVCQTFVQGKTYRRLGSVPCWLVPPGVSGLTQASADSALLPFVSKVGRFFLTSKSHGAREAMFDSANWHSASSGLSPVSDLTQQPIIRVSVVERSSGGLALKNFHLGVFVNGDWVPAASLKVIVPV